MKTKGWNIFVKIWGKGFLFLKSLAENTYHFQPALMLIIHNHCALYSAYVGGEVKDIIVFRTDKF